MKNIKLILSIVIFWCYSFFAQDGSKNQNIELPDFVITGIQSVSVPIMSKKKSEFIPILSDNFLIPNYNTEEFSLLDNSSPIKKEMELNKNDIKYNGLLQLCAGLQTLPIGDLFLGFNKSNFIFNSHVYGSDERKYIPFAGYNTSGAKAKFNYYVNHNSKVLPGLSFGVEGDFVRDLYYFYGTATPSKSRENEYYGGKFFISNQLNKKLKYGFDIKYNNLNMKIDGISENIFSGNSFIEYKFGSFGLSGITNYQVQKITDNLVGYSRADYFEGKAYLHIASSKIFELKLGAQYSQLDTNNIFSPIAVLSIFVEKGVALFVSYEGNSELVTVQNLLNENRFFEKGISHIFTKRNSELKFDIKYDFSDIFEVNAGFHSAKVDNYQFFEDLNNDNKFNVVLANDVKDVGGFLNVIINAKKYGELFANIQLQNITDINDLKIPYRPALNANISYGYMLKFGLYSKLKLNYSKYSYTNLANTQTTSNYINFGLFFKYRIFNSLALTCDLQNLLNRKDFYWKGYQEKPLDAIVGIEYRW